jgi:hypothetical protein
VEVLLHSVNSCDWEGMKVRILTIDGELVRWYGKTESGDGWSHTHTHYYLR